MDAITLDIEAGPVIRRAEDITPADLPNIIANASSPRMESRLDATTCGT